MKLRFWGVRGSIASPGPATVRYGGNTTCLELRTDDNQVIIVDAGTGLHPLSLSLLAELPVDTHILITHTHWDHIQGLPFFIPQFIPGNDFSIYGSYDPVTQKNVGETLSIQLQYSYFPVREVELQSKPSYVTVNQREPFAIADATITPVLLNHPVINLGYRVDCNGKSFFFTGDHEPPFNMYQPGDESYAMYQEIIDERNGFIYESLQGIDVLVADSSYTPEEYRSGKEGWGHGTFDSSIGMARDLGVKQLFFTHHEPTRSDDALEKVYAEALDRCDCSTDERARFQLAREGLEIEW
ncbi:MAG: MBL fold metallo-hydrolase [Mariprofundales bacterium]|nr:MBL fold metallo-hydrolase [Mariprofundales bacterium]